jgi:anthranilate phosphoribosyltransferase
MREYTITPEEVGLQRSADLSGVKGGDPTYNASALRELLSSYIDTPATHILCLNAGAALLANDAVSSWQEGVQLASATLREGKAREKLQDVIAYSQTVAR